MIEKMKMCYVITTVSEKDEMLKGLRDIGIMHISEKQSADRELTEHFQNISMASTTLKKYAADEAKKEKKEGRAKHEKASKKGDDVIRLNQEEFDKLYAEVHEAIEKKSALGQEITSANEEINRISEWGDFSPKELAELKEEGFDFHFYRMNDKDYQAAVEDENIRLIRLADVEDKKTVAVLGTLPGDIQATEFVLPEKSITELKQDIDVANEGIDACDENLKKASKYSPAFKEYVTKAQNDLKFSEADATVQGDEDFVWLSGYIPEADEDKFKAMAAEKSCAWAIEDVDEEDYNIPTKLRYNKVSKLIKPIYDILEIQPGYREQDISLWFFLFFTLFFAMIIGDGAYGILILIATVVLHVRQKKVTTGVFLLYILSIATIIWGAVTGTWFGMESAMHVPFLKSLVIPSIATYPEYFGVTSNETQYAIMKFSLSIGVVQLALGNLLAIKKKLPEKDFSWIADGGWCIANIAMYMLALNLVIGVKLSLKPVFIAIGVAFVLVLLFGGMTPGATFGQSLKSGLANSFTTFLDTISCFGNVMSYIRLFAVGMAGVAISQSFNDIAASMNGILVIAAIIIVVLGHALNIAMCFLSVAVHGVRLNVLEFSGQAGIEWAGIPYEPFKEVK